MKQYKTLYRSQSNSMLGGVAGGLAKYFNTDPILFRILFIVITLAGGSGLIAYIILWIIIPTEPFNYRREKPYFRDASAVSDEEGNSVPPDQYGSEIRKPSTDGGLIAGIILITLGGIFLLDTLIPRINFWDIWPVLLIVVGFVIIFGNLKSKGGD